MTGRRTHLRSKHEIRNTHPDKSPFNSSSDSGVADSRRSHGINDMRSRDSGKDNESTFNSSFGKGGEDRARSRISVRSILTAPQRAFCWMPPAKGGRTPREQRRGKLHIPKSQALNITYNVPRYFHTYKGNLNHFPAFGGKLEILNSKP